MHEQADTPPKQTALAAISALPDKASFEGIVQRLHALEAIREDVEAGGTVSREDAQASLARFRALIDEGARSPSGPVADATFFEALRARIRAAGPG